MCWNFLPPHLFILFCNGALGCIFKLKILITKNSIQKLLLIRVFQAQFPTHHILQLFQMIPTSCYSNPEWYRYCNLCWRRRMYVIENVTWQSHCLPGFLACRAIHVRSKLTRANGTTNQHSTMDASKINVNNIGRYYLRTVSLLSFQPVRSPWPLLPTKSVKSSWQSFQPWPSTS